MPRDEQKHGVIAIWTLQVRWFVIIADQIIRGTQAIPAQGMQLCHASCASTTFSKLNYNAPGVHVSFVGPCILA